MEPLAIILGAMVLCLLVWFAIEAVAEYLVIREVRHQQKYVGGLDVCERIEKIQKEHQTLARVGGHR